MIEVLISDGDIDELEVEHNASMPDPHRYWHFDERRRHVIKSWDDVQACPGSGKTTLVAAKLLILAKKWEEPRRGICVLTHTNVARGEIISRLQDHPAGFKLTSYPHFIGTIQEFVNKFLATPYSRARGWRPTQLGDFEFASYFPRVNWRKFRDRARNRDYWFSYYVNSNRIKMDNFYFCTIDNRLSVNPKFMHAVERQIDLGQGNIPENYFVNKKEEYLKIGVCQFRDAYAFGEVLIHENPDVLTALRKRFSLVIIDEMQDTQKFQDTLINQIFDHEGVSLQRLGDPDQAIFDGIGGDEPNDSYNDNPDLYEIKTTHRFGNDICDKIIGLSYNKLDQLASGRNPDRGDCPHTIFLYDDTTCARVLDAFGELITQADPENNWPILKAVGGVEGSGEVGHISKYWSKFDRSKSVSSPKPKKLIHIAHLCRDISEGHLSSNYELLVQGIVDLLRKANIKTQNKGGNRVYFSRQSLIGWLREKEKFFEFKKLLTSLMLEADLTPDGWAAHVEALKAVLELNAPTAEANEYLAHDAEAEAVDDNAPATNVYTCANGREIEVGTIHSVKGETHDATLLLETKFNRWCDCAEMLPFMLDPAKARPAYTPGSRDKDSTLAQYMRKLYVAGSRPRHLLCIALHKDHAGEEQTRALAAQGWRLIAMHGHDGNA